MKNLEILVFLLTITKGLSNVVDIGLNKVVPTIDEYASDPNTVLQLNEPINITTKLLYDLDAQVQQLFPSENTLSIDEVGTQSPTTPEVSELQTSKPQIYSAINSEFELALTKQGESVNALVTQLDTLYKRIDDTVTELSKNRRYILSAMLRPMLSSVRRIRSNVVRIQTQLTSLQTAASNVGSRPGAQTLGAADQTAIDGIRKRVDDIQKRIGDIIGRISSTLNIPGSPSANNQSSSSTPTGR